MSYYDPAADEGLDKLNKNAIIDSKPNLKLMRHYVKKDDSHLDRCYYLLVLTGDISSSGTAWEMGRHSYKNRRPIILVSPKQYMGSLVNFTTVKATKIYPSIFEAVFSHCERQKEKETINALYRSRKPGPDRSTGHEPETVGDICYIYYKKFVTRWLETPRWTTAHNIYKDVQCIKMDFRMTLDEKCAADLAWQVFYSLYVLEYEIQKRELNGDVV